MTTSSLTRDIIQITICATFLLLVVMVTRVVDGGKGGKCPSGRFGRHCRLTCHCKHDGNCHDVTGKCPRECADGWSGPHCQRQNVALGMPTDMKTPDWSRGARAVDGDVGTCVTSSSNRTGWWRVDMLVQRTVFFMEILFANQTARPGRIRVHVSDYIDTFWGKPCTRIPASHTGSKFACDLPSNGRYFGIINNHGQITLCEVFVFVCTTFTFGFDCSQECACTDPTELCNAVTGTCSTGCQEGFTGSSCTKPCKGRYGPACRYPCGHCLSQQPCDHVTGVCLQGCSPGWTGLRCSQACPPGTYGINCLHRCQHCLDNATCRSEDGTCPWRCEPGWKGARCDLECPRGWHGQSCEFKCGHCYNGSVCQRETGVCHLGCSLGFEGLFCIKECLGGFWGPSCMYTCDHCLNHSCHKETGHCDTKGCQAGWTGEKCDIACTPGHYGRNCLRSCGQCQELCDVQDGTCPSGCQPGWEGRACDDTCSNRTFGIDCASKCGHCAQQETCHHVTGNCPGTCVQGYKKPLCHIRTVAFFEQLKKPNLLTLLIGCMTIFVCTMLGIISCLVVRWKRENSNILLDKEETTFRQTVV